MKINIFTYVFWPEQFLINELAQDFSKNHSVSVLTGLPNYPKGEFYKNYTISNGPYLQTYDKVQVLRYPLIPRKTGSFWLTLNYLTHLFGAFIRSLSLPKSDWVFVFATSPILTAIPAIFWAKLNNAKVCIWLQDLWPDSMAATNAFSKNSIIYRLIEKVVTWIYKNTDLMLIQSDGFNENLKKYDYRGPSYLVPNWAPEIDYSTVQPLSWLPEKKSSQFIVTFAGNIGKAQGLETLVQAAQILQQYENIQFYIVGDGSELQNIRNLIQKNNINNVLFYGKRPVSEMPGLFHHSDALLVTLKKDFLFSLTIPSKVQAYMAAGKPILGSINGVGRNIIERANCGFCSDAQDGKKLAHNILNMSLVSEKDRKILGENGKKYFFDNYQKSTVTRQILMHLEQHK